MITTHLTREKTVLGSVTGTFHCTVVCPNDPVEEGHMSIEDLDAALDRGLEQEGFCNHNVPYRDLYQRLFTVLYSAQDFLISKYSKNQIWKEDFPTIVGLTFDTSMSVDESNGRSYVIEIVPGLLDEEDFYYGKQDE